MQPKATAPAPASVWHNWIHFLAFGFGSGAIPWAPGTMGTIVAIPFFLVLSYLPLPAYLVVVLILFTVGVWLCEIAAKDTGVDDHPGIVWDEIVGYLITMIAVPCHFNWIVAGFILFRIFDIWKPWPIRVIDKQLKGGLGIMLDDVLAGVYALVVLHLMLFLVGL
jgi:phosphatidylglycerophosphatase A